jgi:hypothetical protein
MKPEVSLSKNEMKKTHKRFICVMIK